MTNWILRLNVQGGRDWIPEWEAKVVPASVAKAQTLDSDKSLILCIAGGKHCDAETARQPAPAAAIKIEMASQEFGVRVDLREIIECSTRYPGDKSQPSGFERRSESIPSMRESQR